MKLGFFTDSHYSSQEITCGKRYNSRSLEKIKEAYSFFEQEKCDLIICLGDITDKEDTKEKETENLKEIASVISASHIRTVCVMGNHDAFTFTKHDFFTILNGCFETKIETDDKTLLFLDTCYFSNGTHYSPGDSNWRDTYLPNAAELRSQIKLAASDVYIFMHQNIDPDISKDHRLSNDSEVRDIIKESGKVKAVFQGHYHAGKQSNHDGIEYITFPAMCEKDNAFFIKEI